MSHKPRAFWEWVLAAKFLAVAFSPAITDVLTVAGHAREAVAAEFKAPPAVSEDEGVVKITFATSAATDVEVTILDAEGSAVRHLAAGFLGANAPEPLKKNSLSQELLWDGKDDAGRPAVGGPFKVRVGLGLKADFENIIGWSGQNVEDVRGLCCGPDGTLYLVYGGQHYAHRRTTIISAFDRQGKYLRQIFPGPGGLPAEKRQGWPHVTLDDGRELPIIWHMLSRAVLPSAVFDDNVFPAATGDGRLVIPCGTGESFARVADQELAGGRRLLVMGGDGSVPENYLGPAFADEKAAGAAWPAVSPDGKTAYVCAAGAVRRADLSGSQPAREFVSSGLKDPRGVAVDRDGNVYVADSGNNRVAVFHADGRPLEDLPAKSPEPVQVSRKTGAVYYLSDGGRRLVKLAGLGDPTIKTTLDTGWKDRHRYLLALDDSAEPGVIWLVDRFWHGGKISRLVDQPDGFKDEGDPIARQLEQPAVNFNGGLAVLDGRLITMNTEFGYNWSARQIAFDLETGNCLGPVWTGKQKCNEVVAGKDGLLYGIGAGYKKPHAVRRFDSRGNELPFHAANPLEGFWHGHTRTGGMFVDREGNVYLMGGDAYREHSTATVRRYTSEGKLADKQVVKLGTAYYGGLAVDSHGCVYVGAQVTENDKPIPDWFVGKLPEDSPQNYPSRCYRQYGAVIKFKRSGGAVVNDSAGDHYGVLFQGKIHGPVTLLNAEWLRRGGEVPVRNGPFGVHCFCETSRFDIDRQDRLYVPDVHRFSVQVLDAAGNQIGLIGSYGNMDNRGPKSDHPDPAIAYGWPLAVQVAGDRLYVADVVNRRVVVARLSCAASETCAVPSLP